MAITRLETFTGDDTGVVRLATDDGETGIGQMAPGNADIVTRVFHRFVAPHALGRDPTDIEGVIDGIMETPERPQPYKFPGAFVLRALCGLDTALWDLAGKRAGASVCELLGGSPGEVPAYGSRLERETDADREAAVCARYRDEGGLGAVKVKIGRRLAFRTDEDQWPGRTEAVVTGVREAVGDDVELFVDANSGFSPERAIAVGEEILEPNGVVHYEEPCPYWELDWTAEVREALDLPVAGGEQDIMLGQWGKIWERIVARPVVDVVQPDIGYIGGLTRTKRVADLAAEAGLACTPHGPNHTLQKVFSLHLIAGVDNATRYPLEYRIPEPRRAEVMYAPEPRLENGRVPVPDGPGWGVELDPDWLARTQYAATEA